MQDYPGGKNVGIFVKLGQKYVCKSMSCKGGQQECDSHHHSLYCNSCHLISPTVIDEWCHYCRPGPSGGEDPCSEATSVAPVHRGKQLWRVRNDTNLFVVSVSCSGKVFQGCCSSCVSPGCEYSFMWPNFIFSFLQWSKTLTLQPLDATRLLSSAVVCSDLFTLLTWLLCLTLQSLPPPKTL